MRSSPDRCVQPQEGGWKGFGKSEGVGRTSLRGPGDVWRKCGGVL